MARLTSEMDVHASLPLAEVPIQHWNCELAGDRSSTPLRPAAAAHVPSPTLSQCSEDWVDVIGAEIVSAGAWDALTQLVMTLSTEQHERVVAEQLADAAQEVASAARQVISELNAPECWLLMLCSWLATAGGAGSTRGDGR